MSYPIVIGVKVLLCVVELHEVERIGADEASAHLGGVSIVREP
jgi:hypothetical protein